MEYVVVEIAGKQYRVKPGDILEVDRLNEENGAVTFDKVLLSVAGDDIKIGKPYVDGVAVTGKLLENVRGNKIRVARFTAKSRHRRVVGFRASLSRVQIDKISSGNSSKAEKPVKSTSTKTAKSK